MQLIMKFEGEEEGNEEVLRSDSVKDGRISLNNKQSVMKILPFSSHSFSSFQQLYESSFITHLLIHSESRPSKRSRLPKCDGLIKATRARAYDDQQQSTGMTDLSCNISKNKRNNEIRMGWIDQSPTERPLLLVHQESNAVQKSIPSKTTIQSTISTTFVRYFSKLLDVQLLLSKQRINIQNVGVPEIDSNAAADISTSCVEIPTPSCFIIIIIYSVFWRLWGIEKTAAYQFCMCYARNCLSSFHLQYVLQPQKNSGIIRGKNNWKKDLGKYRKEIGTENCSPNPNKQLNEVQNSDHGIQKRSVMHQHSSSYHATNSNDNHDNLSVRHSVDLEPSKKKKGSVPVSPRSNKFSHKTNFIALLPLILLQMLFLVASNPVRGVICYDCHATMGSCNQGKCSGKACVKIEASINDRKSVTKGCTQVKEPPSCMKTEMIGVEAVRCVCAYDHCNGDAQLVASGLEEGEAINAASSHPDRAKRTNLSPSTVRLGLSSPNYLIMLIFLCLFITASFSLLIFNTVCVHLC